MNSLARARLCFALVLSLSFAFAQTRPGGGGTTPGNGGIVPGNGGAAGGNGGAGGGGATATDPRVTAPAGILVGETATAIAIAGTPAAGGGGTQTPVATYAWTISGGRLVSANTTAAAVTFTSDTAGTLRLTCEITPTGGTKTAAFVDVVVVSPASAGTITMPAKVVTGSGDVTASVPTGTNRTYAWTVSGQGVTITGPRNTDKVVFSPGQPGPKEVTCTVTIQQVDVTVRSYLVVTGSGPAVTVTTANGAGGGSIPGGSRIDVWANPPPAGQVFDKWTGDIAGLANPLAAHTTLLVPATPVALTATFKAAPAWTPVIVANFNPINAVNAGGSTLLHFIPANPVGLVFLFHAAGGGAAGWFNQVEQLTLVRDLVAAGYGVAALDSVNRTQRTWAAQTDPTRNVDALNVVAAHNKFITDKAIAATTPLFLLGMDDGAGFAPVLAQMLSTATPARPVRGAISYCDASTEALALTSHVPQFFALAANDEVLDTQGATDARNNSNFIAGRGLPAPIVFNAASPVHSGRFRALSLTTPTFTATDAQTVWQSLKTAGILDANDYVTTNTTAAALTAAVPANYQARLADIGDQLRVCAGAHAFYSDLDSRILAFMTANAAGPAAVTPPARIVNLSTRGQIAFAGDSITFGFVIGGNASMGVLLRAVGPGLLKYGVTTAMTQPKIELYRGDTVIASNDNWAKVPADATAIAAAAAKVGAFALVATDPDCALLTTLAPGVYTARITGINGSTGEVLAEIYDATKNAARLTNLSTLAAINNAGDLLIPGIVLEGAAGRTVIIRAAGPALGDFGVPGALADPSFTVVTAAGQTVAANNNWTQNGGAVALTAGFQAVGAFAFKTTAADSALATVLAVTPHTIKVAGSANSTGKVLVEVYEVP